MHVNILALFQLGILGINIDKEKKHHYNPLHFLLGLTFNNANLAMQTIKIYTVYDNINKF